MRAAMRRILVAVAISAGCGKSGAGDAPPAPAPAPAKPAVNKSEAGDVAEGSGKAARHEPSAVPPAARREYRRRLSTGRKLARARKWGEATVEFEGALAAIPMDGRALSELGWAAFQAGDHARARKANADAVKVTSEPVLKAASLYNLGRVAEAQDDATAAARFYLESLALRPSKAVVARLTALGRKPPAPGAPPEERPCAAPAREGVCDCLASNDGPDEEGETPTCELVDDVATPDGIAIARVDRSSSEHEFFALVEGKAGWSVAGAVADLYDGGMGGVSNELEWGPIEERRLGAARALWVETVVSGQDHDAGLNESASHETRTVTVCLLERPGGEPGVRPSCPLAVPLSWTYDRDILIEENEDELTAEEKKLHTPGLPIRRSRKLELRLANDGTATVILVEGKADEQIAALLGSRKLF